MEKGEEEVTNKEALRQRLIRKLETMSTEEMAVLLSRGVRGCFCCPYNADGGDGDKCTKGLCLSERKKWLDMEWDEDDKDFKTLKVGILTPRTWEFLK